MKKFNARYDGQCSECGEQISEGDEIYYLDDEIRCSDCGGSDHTEFENFTGVRTTGLFSARNDGYKKP